MVANWAINKIDHKWKSLTCVLLIIVTYLSKIFYNSTGKIYMNYLYKLVFVLLICVWSNLLYAQGDKFGCLNQIDKHVLNNSELTLESCGLNDEDMVQVASFLQKNPSIDSLVLDNNDDITSKGLAILFKNNPHIISLHATELNMDDEGVNIIATLSTLESDLTPLQ